MAAAREAAGYVHPSNKQDNCRFRISHSQTGKLGVTINNGKQCIVVAKLNQNSQLNVNDVILSVNGHKYEDLIKSEWLKLFQAPGVREFIVLRPQENNTEEPTKEFVHLLQLVASQWTTGKSSHQTLACKAAIRNCLLADMRPFTIAKHVVKQVTPELQATEYERAKSCAQRIQQNMNKKSVPKAKTKPLVARDRSGEDDSDDYVPWSGAASIVDSSDEEYNDDDDDDAYESSDEEFETAIVDLEDVMKLGMPFQREGIIFKRGDKPPKRKAAILERGWEANITLSPVKED